MFVYSTGMNERKKTLVIIILMFFFSWIYLFCLFYFCFYPVFFFFRNKFASRQYECFWVVWLIFEGLKLDPHVSLPNAMAVLLIANTQCPLIWCNIWLCICVSKMEGRERDKWINLHPCHGRAYQAFYHFSGKVF